MSSLHLILPILILRKLLYNEVIENGVDTGKVCKAKKLLQATGHVHIVGPYIKREEMWPRRESWPKALSSKYSALRAVNRKYK